MEIHHKPSVSSLELSKLNIFQ